MTPKEIKIILIQRDLSISGLAREFGCLRQELQMCIYRIRRYPELRKKLAEKLGLSEEELFKDSKETALDRRRAKAAG